MVVSIFLKILIFILALMMLCFIFLLVPFQGEFWAFDLDEKEHSKWQTAARYFLGVIFFMAPVGLIVGTVFLKIICAVLLLIQLLFFRKRWEHIAVETSYYIEKLSSFRSRCYFLGLLLVSTACLYGMIKLIQIDEQYGWEHSETYTVVGIQSKKGDYYFNPSEGVGETVYYEKIYLLLDNGKHVRAAYDDGSVKEDVKASTTYKIGDTVHVFMRKIVTNPDERWKDEN